MSGRRTRGNLIGRLVSAAAEQVERARWLDPAAQALQHKLEPLRRSRWLTDLMSGTPLGHPLHPILVTVPIGSWAGALVFDLIGNRPAARTMVGFGVLAAAPSVLTGLSDWKDTDGAARRVGLAHAALNVGLVSVYSASWLARRIGAYRLGARLTWPGLVLIGASGWLGGHLIYARGIGVDVNAWPRPREDWSDVGPAVSVTPGRLQRVEVDGEAVLVTRTAAGSLVAYADRCAHRGGSLSQGRLTAEDCVECPRHGSRFSLRDGSVLSGPATRPQSAYDVRLDNDRVLVRRVAPL